ncbi:MAG: glutamate racemase [Kiritimatiellae bacterium]|nr:glutamate racemase [Kiritimatiellia bacterium]
MKNEWQDNPIGVFDSGVGGLTVLKELIGAVPFENVIYFGDTARVPYGTKSRESVIKYSGEIVEFLVDKKVKLILAACNTVSSLALPVIRKAARVPVIGVLEPGARCAVKLSKTGKIGVIGTTATINSCAYEKALRKYCPGISVVSQACPLFVPLIEEGWTDKKITREIVKEYLAPFVNSEVDTVILGCTHYPLIKKIIKQELGSGVQIVDSATAVAMEVGTVLKKQGLERKSSEPGYRKFYVSDAPAKFKKLGGLFMGMEIVRVEKVAIDDWCKK